MKGRSDEAMSPVIFSREYRRIMTLGPERTVTETPIGLFPAAFWPTRSVFDERDLPRDASSVNEIELLGAGDILLLVTDGLTDHGILDIISNDPDEALIKIHLLSEFKGTAEAAVTSFQR